MDQPTVERVHLDATSWVDVVRGMAPHHQQVHDDLLGSVRWEQGRVFRYERWIDDPRLSGWQAPGAMHPALAEVQAWISATYRVSFDGVALARYRDGHDSVGWHRDRELRWLEQTVIGVLSLGAARSFLVKPATWPPDRGGDDRAGAIELAPAGGDLLVMGGRCQADWLHAVPRLDRPTPSRMSAQWRWTSRRGRPDTAPGFFEARRFSDRRPPQRRR